MRAFGFLVLLLGLALSSSHAFAQTNSNNDNNNNGRFPFKTGPAELQVSASGPGCVEISISAGYNRTFPSTENGLATRIHFYYSTTDLKKVTLASPYEEACVTMNARGEAEGSPTRFCGYAAGTYFFKYALFDADNNLLHFMADSETSSYDHSAKVEPYIPPQP